MTTPPDLDWHGLDAATPPNGTRPTDQPHDDTAERAVLGAALLAPHLIPDLAAVLRDDDFHHAAHQRIWDTLTDLAATGTPVDELTVWQALSNDTTVRRAGGALVLHACVENVPTPTSGTYYAQIVADLAQDRRDIATAIWLDQAARNGTDRDVRRERLEKHLGDTNPTRRTASSWRPVDLDDALTGRDTEDRPTLMPRSDGQHLLYPGVNVLAGEPTSGKTWIALHAVTHELAQGNPVTYIDFEDRASRVVARLLALGATPTQIRQHFRYIRPHLAIDPPGRDALTAAAAGSTLAVLDGVTEAMTLHGLDLSSNPDVATFYALLPRWIADQGPAVLLIDHVVKDNERQGRWSIGGQHKLAGLDGASYTVKNVEPLGRGKRGTSRVFIAKDRHGHVEEHALGRCAAEFHLDSTDPNVSVATLDPPEAMPTTDAGDMRPTVLMERVSRWLEVNPRSSLNAVKAGVPGKGQYVAKALAQLVTEGHVTTATGTRNTLHHTVLEPFRRDPEAPDDHPV